jgi:hypothetical protein
MFDDLAAYFYENVVTPFEEYLEVKSSGKAGRNRDARVALTAATSLYHLREHLPPLHALTRAEISSNHCADYSLLGDVVNAAKHRFVTRGSPQISDAAQIEEQVVVTEYQDEQGPYRWVEKIVAVGLVDGSTRDLLEVLVNVMNFWQSYLHSIGVISNPRSYSVPQGAQPKSRADCAESRLDLEIVKGLRFKQSWRLQRYNYTTGKIEPVDLTGSEIRFRIYKPRFDVDLSLRNDVTGQEFSRTITLSDEDCEALSGFRTEEEKQAFVSSLPQAQEALRKLAEAAGIHSITNAKPEGGNEETT